MTVGDFARRKAAEEAAKAYRRILRQRGFKTASSLGQVGCLNADRTKITINGREYPVTVIGNPTRCCFAQEIAPGRFLVRGPKPQFIQMDGKTEGALVLYSHTAGLGFFTEKFRVKKTDESEIYHVQDTFEIVGDTEFETIFSFIKFTLDGANIVALHYQNLDDGNIKFFWGVLSGLNFVKATDEDPVDRLTGTLTNGTYTLDTSILPIAATPSAPSFISTTVSVTGSTTDTRTYEADSGASVSYNGVTASLTVDVADMVLWRSGTSLKIDLIGSVLSEVDNAISYRIANRTVDTPSSPVFCPPTGGTVTANGAHNTWDYAYTSYSAGLRDATETFHGVSDTVTITMSNCIVSSLAQDSVGTISQPETYIEIPTGSLLFPPSVDTDGSITGTVDKHYMRHDTIVYSTSGNPYLRNTNTKNSLFSIKNLNAALPDEPIVNSAEFGTTTNTVEHNTGTDATPSYWFDSSFTGQSADFEFGVWTDFLEAGFRNDETTVGLVSLGGTNYISTPYVTPTTPITGDDVALFTDTHTILDGEVAGLFGDIDWIKPLSSETFLSVKGNGSEIKLFVYNTDLNQMELSKTFNGSSAGAGYVMYDWAMKS